MNKLGKITLTILRYAATGAAIYVASSSSTGARKISSFFIKEASRRGKSYIRKKIKELEAEGYISLGDDKIKLTKKGKYLLEHTDIYDIKIPIQKWGKKWRIVAYDIPNEKSKLRNIFRSGLVNLGFKYLQKSLFVIPYECKEEIAILASRSCVSDYVIYMHADDIPQEIKYIKIFKTL